MTEEHLFELSLQAPEAERAALLDRECAGKPELRARVEALLSANGNSNRGFDSSGNQTDSFTQTDGEVGAVIAGKYRLIELIGEGGMGSVWLADQTEPVKRRVAVKLIKAGMDSKQVIARFEAERQALAVMDHPNIAKVLDGGLQDSRPFFVMELVKGAPITQYCDANRLTPRERLELFVPVCQAIQHAHQKGIIHRDIKPSNVLIAPYDDRPVPKVIDFGLAKATGVSLMGASQATNFGGVVGTPQYMSPEQASLNNLDIDTRSDVYSLGVLLYELLTGTAPFARKDLEKAGMLEILRVIREEEPPRPSTKLSSAEALPSISANRSTEPRKLTGILRNELDWIVMKALEKDRGRRYETANGLAADVNRYLGGEPVVAHPPSAGYRMKKLLRRNKGQVIGTIAVVMALAAGMIAFAWQARVAHHERDRAMAAESDAIQRARELKMVSDFQAEMLGQIDPVRAGRLLTADVQAKHAAAVANTQLPENEKSTELSSFARQWRRVNATDAARELIDRTILQPAAKAVDTKFKDQPIVHAHLQQVLAQRYCQLGLFAAAYPLQFSALQARRRCLGESHEDTLLSIGEMAFLLQHQGRLVESEQHYQEALSKSKEILGDDHPDTYLATSNYGAVLLALGKIPEAELVLRDVITKCRRTLGDDHSTTLFALNNMSRALQSRGQLAEAEPLLRLVVQNRRRVSGPEHQDTIVAINNLALLLQAKGDLAEAEPLYREALSLRRRTLGEEHLDTLVSVNNMGFLLRNQGNLTEAELCYREALEKCSRILGRDHPLTLTAINNMGGLLKDQGKLDEAESYCREAVAALRRQFGSEHSYTLISSGNLAGVLLERGKHSEVILLLSPIEELIRKSFTGSNAKQAAGTLLVLGKAHYGMRDYGNAVTKLSDAHATFVTLGEKGWKDADQCVHLLATVYTAWHEAEPGKNYDAKASAWKARLGGKSP